MTMITESTTAAFDPAGVLPRREGLIACIWLHRDGRHTGGVCTHLTGDGDHPACASRQRQYIRNGVPHWVRMPVTAGLICNSCRASVGLPKLPVSEQVKACLMEAVRLLGHDLGLLALHP